MLAFRKVIIVFLQFFLLDGISGDYQITVAVFSGRKDPQWLVTSKDPMHAEIENQLNEAIKNESVYLPENMPSRLGYKGFLVKVNKQRHLIVGPETVPLQMLLLETMPKSLLSTKVYQRTAKVISAGNVTHQVTTTRVKRFRPPFEIAPWSSANVRENNNCYNYANIRITNTFAQPGRAAGQLLVDYTAAEVRQAAVNDGLVVVADGSFPARTRHVVALFVEEGEDYHWYRRDGDGKWSHKPGTTSVTRIDNSRNLITDPRNCDWYDFRFVCFMTSDRNAVNII